MADRSPVPVSRARRPRTRSQHQFPCVPVCKVGRPRSKSVYQSKVTVVSKKNPTKWKSVKTTPLLGQDLVVIINPGEQPEDLDFPHLVDQLPDLSQVELDQVLNNNNNPQHNQLPDPQLNPPNQPLHLPTEEPNQPNQPQNPPDNPPNQPKQPQNPPSELQKSS